MQSNGHNGDRNRNGHNADTGLNGHNGHNGHRGRLPRNGHGNGARLAGLPVKPCPKCEGCVLERYDLYVGWEPYCVNCGWTPLTSLDAHRISEEELRALGELRRWGQRWVSFSESVGRAGGR